MSGFANPVAVETQSEALEEREIAQELGMTDDSDVGSFFRSDALGREKAHQNLHELLGNGTPLADLSPGALESCKLAFTVMDMDESGSLGQDELETAIRVLGGMPTQDEMTTLMRDIGGSDETCASELPANLCLGRSS